MRTERKLQNQIRSYQFTEHLADVSQACRVMGYSRDSYYRIKELNDTGQGVLGDGIKNCGYETGDEVHGTLTITRFDPSQLIIAGTFEFEAYSPECNEFVKVTEGRFDLVYAP